MILRNEDIGLSLVEICPKCKEISGNYNTIGCDGLCQQWFHYSCAGPSGRSEFEGFSFSEESWGCKDCRLRQQKQVNAMQEPFVADQLTLADSNDKYTDNAVMILSPYSYLLQKNPKMFQGKMG